MVDLAKYFRLARQRGGKHAASELFFRVARRLSTGPENAADSSHEREQQQLRSGLTKTTLRYEKVSVQLRRVTKTLEQTTKKLEQTLAKLEVKTSKLEVARQSVTSLKAQRADFKEKLGLATKALRVEKQVHQSLVKSRRIGPLYAYRTEDLAISKCPICEAEHTWVLSYPYGRTEKFNRLLVQSCASCGMSWVPALPFSLVEYYAASYSAENRRDRDLEPEVYFSDNNPLLAPEARRPYFGRAQEQLSLIRAFKPKLETMLDFGAGPGYALYLSGATEKHAIEPDQDSEKYLEYLGARRLQLDDLPAAHYDVILASHSIEHLPVEELFPTLEKLRTALRADGLLCVEVPCAPLGRLHLPQGHDPHTLFFSPVALETALRRAHFDILKKVVRVPANRSVVGEPLHTVLAEDDWASTTGDGLFIIACPRPKTEEDDCSVDGRVVVGVQVLDGPASAPLPDDAPASHE